MPTQATKSVIVKASASECFRAWADVERFPQFMRWVQSVTKTGSDMSHWVAQGPMGRRIEWDARTTRMEENRRIAWNSTRGDVETTGQVTFNDLPDGDCEVTCVLQYDIANPVAKAAGDLLADLQGRLNEDLRNFKSYCEAAVRVGR